MRNKEKKSAATGRPPKAVTRARARPKSGRTTRAGAVLRTADNRLEPKGLELETGHNDLVNLFASAEIAAQDSRIEGVVITLSDITRMKVQSEELRRLNEDLKQRLDQATAEVRRLIEAVADATVIVSARGEIVAMNQRTLELFGWSRGELQGRSIELLVPERLRDPHAGDPMRYFETPPARPMGAGRELFGRRRDGSEFAIDVQLSPMEMNGEPVTVAAIRDVSERKLAEAMRNSLEAIVESTAAAILLIDLDGTIRRWNRAAEKLYGYAAPEAVGLHIDILLPPERKEEFRDELVRLGHDERVEGWETVRMHHDGTRIDVALTVSLVKDDTGRATGLCAIYYDIRPRKRLEQQMAELLEQERQRVGRELHDTLGQQLTGVGLLVTSLKAQLGQGSRHDAAVAHLEQAVDQSKAQLRSLIAGTFPVEVDAERLTWALRDLAHETSRRYGLNCRFEDGQAVPIEDSFVATQLFLIAREAVHNAVRHAQAKEIVILLEREGGARLSVRDDGRGMPATVDESATMGLRIMRYRSGLIGGRLHVESRPEGGTVLTMASWGTE